jgi:hypothetical protein
MWMRVLLILHLSCGEPFVLFTSARCYKSHRPKPVGTRDAAGKANGDLHAE